MRHNNSSTRHNGFTLLELIIVIIVVAVLASLALPRFSKIIERSRGTEALIFFTQLRPAMEMCYLNTRDYTKCNSTGANPFENVSLQNPSQAINSHFSYSLFTTPTYYGCSASRNTYEAIYPNTGAIATCSFPEGSITSPEPSSVIFCSSPSRVYKTGIGIYEGL